MYFVSFLYVLFMFPYILRSISKMPQIVVFAMPQSFISPLINDQYFHIVKSMHVTIIKLRIHKHICYIFWLGHEYVIWMMSQ